jgi:large subunit ribosomal protein L6
MSRVGLKPIELPSGVSFSQNGQTLTLTGPKGSHSFDLPQGITVKQQDQSLSVSRQGHSQNARSLHGLGRAMLQNAVTGVSQGYEVKLEVHGVGYKVNVAGNVIKLWLGRSHEQEFQLPDGVSASLDQNVLSLSGIDKIKVGQAASSIRSLKKPEPYKGKGIRVQGEYVIRKSGKTAVAKE